MYRFDVDIIVTNFCDRRCPYCDTWVKKLWTLDKPVTNAELETWLVTLENLFDKAKYLSLSGGEPGFIPISQLQILTEKVFAKYTDKTKIVYTYGLFLDKFYDIANQYFDSIVVHISPDLDNYSFNIYDNEKVIYHVVLHRHNLHLVKPFLEKHKDIAHKIRFGIFVSDLHELRERYEVDTDSIRPVLDIIEQYGSQYIFTNNILLPERIKDLFREFCFKYASNIVVDFPQRKLLRCCWLDPPSVLQFKDLNQQTLHQFLSQPFNKDACKHCHHFPTLSQESLKEVVKYLRTNKL